MNPVGATSRSRSGDLYHTASSLVFDLDGTLSDPFEGIWRSVNYALEHHGHPLVSREAFRPFIGPPIDVIFETLAADVDASAVDSLVAVFRDRYGRAGYAENALYPDIPRVLAHLTGAGFRCGICTSKRRDFAVQVLELFELYRHFDFVAGGDVGVRKADQLAELLADGRIGRDAVMIGDRALDLDAAADNGLKSIGVTWGYGSRAELEQARPFAIADAPEALLEFLMPRPAPPPPAARRSP